jgi:hypothetical protein
MTKEQYELITRWQDQVFTSATPLTCVNHLQEEVNELKAGIEQGNVDQNEIADCFLLLIGVCNRSGMTYQNIVDAIDSKMQINYARSWGKPNEKGYQKHVPV